MFLKGNFSRNKRRDGHGCGIGFCGGNHIETEYWMTNLQMFGTISSRRFLVERLWTKTFAKYCITRNLHQSTCLSVNTIPENTILGLGNPLLDINATVGKYSVEKTSFQRDILLLVRFCSIGKVWPKSKQRRFGRSTTHAVV